MRKEVESRGPAIIGVAIISPIISGFFVALRVYTRAFLVKRLGWEDCKYSKTLTFRSIFDDGLRHIDPYACEHKSNRHLGVSLTCN